LPVRKEALVVSSWFAEKTPRGVGVFEIVAFAVAK
jgi:hypothetical protein